MSLLKKVFGKKKSDKSSDKPSKIAPSSAVLKIQKIDRLTTDAVKVTFEVPLLQKELYLYKHGQYLSLTLNLDGKEVRRSYSICSDVNDPLAIGVKKIENGYVSAYFNDKAKVGDKIEVGTPEGNFTIPSVKGKLVGIAGGSGITPLLSMAKLINRTEGAELDLIYGNRDEQSIMFVDELDALSPEKVRVTHVFSEEEKEGITFGMMTEEVLSSIFENNPELIKAAGFYICGPEPVIMNAKKMLESKGIPADKIFFELFTTPVNMESTKAPVTASKFKGVSQVTVMLDGGEETFDLSTKGSTILEEAESHGMDAPYSCRGGICSSCKAKILEGTAEMEKNFTLSEEDIAEGYILTCQAHPTSQKITVTYDE